MITLQESILHDIVHVIGCITYNTILIILLCTKLIITIIIKKCIHITRINMQKSTRITTSTQYYVYTFEVHSFKNSTGQ